MHSMHIEQLGIIHFRLESASADKAVVSVVHD